MKKLLLMALAMTCLWTTTHAQVGINTTTPNATLDVVGTDSGILIPRVALTATNDATPIDSPTISELIYNTASAGTGVNAVTPGYYYWNGTLWVRLNAGTDATTNWSLTGNAGTNPATNFVGTTDAQALQLRTNSTARLTIPNANQVHAMSNGTAALPFYSWSADTNMGIFRQGTDVLGFSTNGTERFRIPNANQVHAMSNGTAALPFYSWSADTNMGMYRIGADILGLSTTGAERMRIDANGRIGINQNNPLAFLHITNPLTGDLPAGGPGIYSHMSTTTSDWYAIEAYNQNTAGGGGILGTGFFGVRGNSTNVELGWAGFFNGDILSRDNYVDRDIIALWGVSELSDTATDDLAVWGNFTTPSDARLKSNISDLTNTIDLIKQLKPKKYQKNIDLIDRKAGKTKLDNLNNINSNALANQNNDIYTNVNDEKLNETSSVFEFGLIAQELETVLPELVIDKKVNLKGVGETDLKTVNYIGLIPILTKAIQEQQEIIESQEARIAKLETLVQQLLDK